MPAESEIRRRLEREPYFINIRRFGYDLRNLEQRYANEPDGIPDHVIAQALQVDESTLAVWYKRVAKDLQTEMGVT
jgi:hypothetical protein